MVEEEKRNGGAEGRSQAHDFIFHELIDFLHGSSPLFCSPLFNLFDVLSALARYAMREHRRLYMNTEWATGRGKATSGIRTDSAR